MSFFLVQAANIHQSNIWKGFLYFLHIGVMARVVSRKCWVYLVFPIGKKMFQYKLHLEKKVCAHNWSQEKFIAFFFYLPIFSANFWVHSKQNVRLYCL